QVTTPGGRHKQGRNSTGLLRCGIIFKDSVVLPDWKRLAVTFGLPVRPVLSCVDPCELCAEQEHLRRVIDPNKQHDQRTRSGQGGDRALLPTYRPISTLPSSKSTAVTMAPIQTSRQAMVACGMNLNIIAKRNVVMQKVIRVFANCSMASIAGNRPPAHCPSAARLVLTTRETIRRKARPRTRPKERRRVRIAFHIPF